MVISVIWSGVIKLGGLHINISLRDTIDHTIRVLTRVIRRKHLPEAFLWHVFHSLAQTVHAMEYGPFQSEARDKLDFEVVHRDIKPRNSELISTYGFSLLLPCGALTVLVFLGAPRPCAPEGKPCFHFYPTPKLGDFGLAIKTHRYDKNNPRKYCGPGTRWYRAPVCALPSLSSDLYNPEILTRRIGAMPKF